VSKPVIREVTPEVRIEQEKIMALLRSPVIYLISALNLALLMLCADVYGKCTCW